MPRASEKRPPSSFDFEDYRAFLQAWFRFRKSRARGYSFGAFAKRAGIFSRSHLKLVMDGKRNLGPGMVERYVQGLGITGAEAALFRALVQWRQGRSPGERESARAEISRLRTERRTRRLGAQEAEDLYRRWDASLILSMTMLKGFRADPRWIRRRSRGRISVPAAREAMRWLRERGYSKGRKGRMRSAGEGALEFPEMSRERSGRVVSWLARGMEDPGRPAEFGDASILVTALTPAEARELQRKLWRWFLENVPDHSLRPVDGELCVVLGDVFPITLRPGR